jgi:ribosomal RNA-processing protein 9
MHSAISLWNSQRKKPILTRTNAHGVSTKVKINGIESCTSTEVECGWITALECYSFTDLFVSGSADGYVKLWKISESKKSFSLLNCIPGIIGFVNSLRFFEIAVKSSDDSNIINKKIKGDINLCLAICTGTEHKFGRWYKFPEAKNEVKVINFGVV